MFAKLLADSGGADQIVDTIVGKSSRAGAAVGDGRVGALIGLPMFFEIGLVLLMPVIYLVARRSQLSVITIGIPTLAGLSAMHGLVPPHPGPLLAIDTLDADLGLTLMLGCIVAIPTVIVGRAAVRSARRPLGRRTARRDLFERPGGDRASDNRPSLRHHPRDGAAAGGADDGQGDRRHRRRRPRRTSSSRSST